MALILPYRFREMAFRHYFNIFIDVLVKTGYEGELPTYEQLQQEIKAHSCIGNYNPWFILLSGIFKYYFSFYFTDLYFQSTMGLFLHMDRSKMDFQMDAFMTDRALRRSVYNGEAYIAHIKEVVPKLLDEITIEWKYLY